MSRERERRTGFGERECGEGSHCCWCITVSCLWSNVFYSIHNEERVILLKMKKGLFIYYFFFYFINKMWKVVSTKFIFTIF